MGTRKTFAGAAAPTTLSGGITNVAASFVVAAGTGVTYPSTGLFVIVLDRGTSSEEKLLCSARSNDTFTVSTRGYDGTTGVSHAGGASVNHTIDSITVDEANLIASAQTTKGDAIGHDGTKPVRIAVGGTDGYVMKVSAAAGTGVAYGQPLSELAVAKGDLLVASGAGVVSRLAVGANLSVLEADSAQGTGVKWRPLTVGNWRVTSNFTITADASYHPISWDAEDLDSSGLTGVPWTTLSAIPAGLYSVHIKGQTTTTIPGGSSIRFTATETPAQPDSYYYDFGDGVGYISHSALIYSSAAWTLKVECNNTGVAPGTFVFMTAALTLVQLHGA